MPAPTPPGAASPSPSLSPTDEADTFGDSFLFESPDNSGSDTDTDSTLSDVEQCSPDFGHPLERMERTELLGGGLDIAVHDDTRRSGKLRLDANEIENVQRFVDAAAIDPPSTGFHSLTGQTYESPTGSSSTSTVSTRPSSYYLMTDLDFEKVVDCWASKQPPTRQNIPSELVIFDPSTSNFLSNNAFMTRCFPSKSVELSLYEEANEEGWRRDPWNPIPHILHSFDRDAARVLCMERLMKYNDPPLLTIANYVDFFRQILEGLTFLHEKYITLGSCSDTGTFMVDLSSGISTSKSYTDLAASFDRSILPVKYYFTDLSKAQRVQLGDDMKRDVQDCAVLFDTLLSEVQVPQVTTKFQNLIRSMLSGTFGADDSRKLLEAMCRSMDGRLLRTAVDGKALDRAVNRRPGDENHSESPRRQTTSLPMTPGNQEEISYIASELGCRQRVRHTNSYPAV